MCSIAWTSLPRCCLCPCRSCFLIIKTFGLWEVAIYSNGVCLLTTWHSNGKTYNDGNFVLSLSNYDLFLLCVQSHLPRSFGRLCVQLRELHCLDVVYALVVHVFLSLKLLACGRWLSILMECVYWLLHRCCHPSFIDVTSFTIAY
jgi:hypothetical protein